MKWKFWAKPDQKKLAIREFHKIYDKYEHEGVPIYKTISIVTDVINIVSKMVHDELKEDTDEVVN